MHDKKEWTPYTMSLFFPTSDEKRFEKDGIYSSTWSFIFRALDKSIIRVLRGSFAMDPEFKINEAKYEIVSLDEQDIPDFSSPINFKTRSPLIILSPEHSEDGKDAIGPENDYYEDVFIEKMQKFYNMYHETDKEFKVDLEIKDYERKGVRVSKKGFALPAYELEGRLDAPQELLEFCYLGGFGAKTALGLGCWDVVK